MRAIYWHRPTAQELSGTGLTFEHYPEPVAKVDPDCWDAVNLFLRNSTQWRVSAAGATGLDYTAIRADERFCAMSAEDRKEAMDYLRVIEREAVTVMQEK